MNGPFAGPNGASPLRARLQFAARHLAGPQLAAPLTAGAIMTHNVVTVAVGCSLQVAVGLMVQRRVSGVPVLDEAGRLVGMMTQGDLLRRAEVGTDVHRTGWLQSILGPRSLADDPVETHSRLVGDVMTAGVVTVDVSAPLADVVALMRAKQIKRVPVMAGRSLAGIVSRSDLMRTLADTFGDGIPGAHSGERSDATIYRNVLAELERQSWGAGGRAGGGVSVIVTEGVVDLGGVILEESERGAVHVAAANVPGVVEVRGHLSWVDPVLGMSYTPLDAEPT